MRSVHNSSNENQIRVRRRQSDARWRANLSCCYETLKHIIPVTKRATRRKISKAIILKETAKHIDFLESMVVTLLQEKAEKQGVKNVNRWCTKKVNQLQENFTVSQKQQNITITKKLTRDHKNAHEPTRYICSGLDREVDGVVETCGLGRSSGRRASTNVIKSLEMTPVKDEGDAGPAIGFTPVKLPPSRCWAQTPTKIFETLDVSGIFGDYTGGITQIYCTVVQSQMCLSCVKQLQHILNEREQLDRSLFVYEEEDNREYGTQQLLCTERMWLSDDEDASVARNQQTPKSRKSAKGSYSRGPRKRRRKLEENAAASTFAYSVHQHKKIHAESHAKETVKCCRALNLDGWTAGKMIIEQIPGDKQQDLNDSNPLLPLSGTDLYDEEQSMKEFETEFCILEEMSSSSTQDIATSLPWRDDSPLLSQTSSAFIANTDDHVYSVNQTSCSQFVPVTGDFSSEGSQSYMAPSPHTELDFDVKPLVPDVSLYEGDGSSMTLDQPEYLGQYSPLFGQGIASLLSL